MIDWLKKYPFKPYTGTDKIKTKKKKKLDGDGGIWIERQKAAKKYKVKSIFSCYTSRSTVEKESLD